MEKKTKNELKKIIDNLENDDNVLLITNNYSCIVGSAPHIFANLVIASLKQEPLKQLIKLIKEI